MGGGGGGGGGGGNIKTCNLEETQCQTESVQDDISIINE